MTDSCFTCSCCGRQYDGLPDLAFGAPAVWTDTLAAEDLEGNRLDSDFCVAGGRDYLIRCVLEVPIKDTGEHLGWGVWASQSESDFWDYRRTFHDNPERATFGFLCNRLPLYPETVGLKTRVHWRSGRDRPRIELAPCDHPLYRDWLEGIARDRAIEFAQLTHRQ